MNDSRIDSKPKKILIMRIDNSGKTSILLSLRENANLLSYISLKPTKGLVVEEFDDCEQKLVCWDLGGQAQYRKGYLKDFGKYTKEASKIIYVIDIQDKKRYGLALNYLQELMNFLKNDDQFIEISIFLHKFDPNLIKQEKFKDIYQIVNTELVDKIKAIIPEKFNYSFYKTTIYTVFEKTLF